MLPRSLTWKICMTVLSGCCDEDLMASGAARLDGLGSVQLSVGPPCHGVKADCAHE